jgi:hypothetical protein
MIFVQITEQLQSLGNLLLLLNDKQYKQEIAFLGNASIGSHTRHIIELLACATNGYDTGAVDYIRRVRDIEIETDRLLAIKQLNLVSAKIQKTDKQIDLVIDGSEEGYRSYLSTTYFREIVYNAEHIIHHLAFIRVALREMNLEIVGENFGMAYSTLKYRATQDKVKLDSRVN